MDRRRRYDRRQSMAAAELGPLPEVMDSERRAACERDLHRFLVEYFPHSTGLSPFSDDHQRVISRIEHCLLEGGRFVNAVYRGFAKTTITELSALWAALYGHRKFIAIFGADESAAQSLVDSISRELEENDLLAADFPEVCLPFQHLDGKPQRCRSQTQGGEHTHIRMHNGILVLPTIWDEHKTRCTPSSGVILRARGLLGGTRGMAYKRPDGTKSRPDFALIDDPQTDESATHANQVETRLSLIRKAILKSAGHSKTMACVINATVIAENDLVDQLLDAERNPSWQGERIPMVRQWADAHDSFWLGPYAETRRQYDRDLPGAQQEAARRATELYRQQREAADAGGQVSWESCYDATVEISALQHAYNLYLDDPPEVFASECQLQPIAQQPPGLEKLDPVLLARKVNGHPRESVPVEASHLTGFIDVHDDLLYWILVAWQVDCTAAIVNYGTWPEQRRGYFLKRQATNTLARKYKGLSREARLVSGLEDLIERLCQREYPRTDGTPQRLDKLGVDAGYSPDEVELVCRRSPQAALLQMTRGIGIKAGDTPIREYKRKRGWRFGEEWYIKPDGSRALRQLRFDSNHWKTWTHARLALPIASPTAASLYGVRNDVDHRLLADHLTAELPTETEGKGRTCIEWRLKPGLDNHWLDGLIGNAVLASLLGCRLQKPSEQQTSRRRRALEAARKAGRLG